MSPASVAAFLERHRTIGLDTSVFIFKVEVNTRYVKLVNPVFNWLQSLNGAAATSTVTMLEVLVLPYRNSNMELVNRFYALLSTYPNLRWIAPTLEIADRAAQLRADYDLHTPDALQRSLLALRPLVRGRLFDARDDMQAPRSVIVSREFVRQLFPGEEAIGRRIVRGELTWTIIGVADAWRASCCSTTPRYKRSSRRASRGLEARR